MSTAGLPRRPTVGLAAPEAAVLAAAAALTWYGRATASGITAGAIGAFIAAFAARRLARAPLRTWVVPAAALAGAGLLLGLLRLAALAPVPGDAPWPEFAAAARDALALTILSAGGALVLGFLAARVRLLRVLPLAALVLAAGALLAPHRGGAINRPHAVSDLAWLRGWHPALVLTLAGVAAGVVAAMALLRLPGRRRALFGAAAALFIAALVLASVPSFGLLEVPVKDPLGLSGKPKHEQLGGGGSGEGAAGGDRRGNQLGLEAPGGGGGQPELVPFQDDYSSNTTQVPAAVVVLHDDVAPAMGTLYFRQVAFSSWNGRRLVRSFDPGVDQDLFEGFAESDSRAPPPLEDTVRTRVPASVSLLRDHVQPPVLADGTHLEPQENADPALFRRTYRTISHVLIAPPEGLFGRRAGDPAWVDEARRTYLEVPGDPRYRALAEEIAATLRPEWRADPWARAVAVALWLQQNTQYSVRSRHAAAADPTASYLFGDRIGYCVHLSHAAAYLARALGVPARVAAGYAYTAADRADGSALLLRSGDAHAWAEVFLEGVGWVPLDPTPPSLDPPLASPDLDLQRLLGEMARPKTRIPGAPARPARRFPRPGEIALALAAGLVAIVGTGHAIKGWRRVVPLVARRDPAARSAYRASLDRLAEAGVARAHGETREAFAARAAGVSPSFARLTALHLAARFGRRDADPRAARQLGADVAREVARRTPRGRRLAGLLAPFRWLRSR